MKYILIALILFTCASTQAQVNLVLNPSLEKYDTCPSRYDDIRYAQQWTSLDTAWIHGWTGGHGTFGVPEYCHECAGGDLECGVPLSSWYNHYPRTGKGMSQVQTYYFGSFEGPQHRDYLQGHLESRLTAGKSYCVSFYVTQTQASLFAHDHIGAYLDDGTIDTTTQPGMPQRHCIPQVVCSGIIDDTLNWVKIQGSFVATGTENRITIGNFEDRAHTNAIPAHGQDTTGAYTGASYSWYLVDDVSVIDMEANPNAGADRVLPATGADSVWVGDTTDSYLPVYWYANGVLIDSNKGGIKVRPDTTTTYIAKLDVCSGGEMSSDTAVVWVGEVGITSPAARLAAVRLYPNPTSNQMTVTGAAGAMLLLHDVVGRALLSTPLTTTSQTIDLAALPTGTYLATISWPTGEKRTIRVVKE